MVTEWEYLSDNIWLDDATEYKVKKFKARLNDMDAEDAFCDRLSALSMREGVFIRKSVEGILEEVAEDYDLDYGIAGPTFIGNSVEYPFLAKNATMAFRTAITELEQATADLKHYIKEKNSWRTQGKRITLMQDEAGFFVTHRTEADSRFEFFTESLLARSGTRMSVEAEFKALELLKTRVSKKQYSCYVLNNAFMERSERSQIFYVFRKGLPTIALRENRKVLACLCFHPYGYFSGTHTGVMCPTDEVVAALLYMRAAEPKFWAKSGQWQPDDSRSGL